MQQKNYSLIIALLFFTNSLCYAQTVTQAWASFANNVNPQRIAIDASGNLFVRNEANIVSKITQSGVLTSAWATLANGSGSSSPSGIAIDASGNVYTANANNTVSKITPSGTVTEAWANLAYDASPRAIAIDALGNIYTANDGNSTVSKITQSGTVTQSWANLASSSFTNVGPRGIAIDASGNVFIANQNTNTVSKITSSGTVTHSWANLAIFSSPQDIAIDATGNIYTANNGTRTVSKITSSGTVTQAWAILASDARPYSIAIDASGNVYAANRNSSGASASTVSKITPSGLVVQAWASLANNATPFGIAIDASGNIFTANYYGNTVSKITPSPLPLTILNYTTTLQNNQVLNSLQTTNEVNVSHINVQRSIDGLHFIIVGKVNAKGGGLYQYWDNQLPTAAKLYYRLEMVDKDGKFSYSVIKSINFNSTKLLEMQVSPNPTKGVFAIKLDKVQPNTKLVITNILGKHVLVQNINSETTTINATLTKGVYVVKLIANNTTKIEKLVVE